MSLIYSHRQEDRTLDLMCQTEEEFNLWYNALKYVWDQIRSRSSRSRDLLRGLQQGGGGGGGGTPGTRGINNGSPSSGRCPATVGIPLGGGQSHGFANQNLGIPASRNIPGDCYIWGAAAAAAAEETVKTGELVKVSSPQLVPSSQKLDIIQVSCGSTHFASVTRSGHLYSWGSGPSGALGLGSTQFLSTPTTIPDICSVRSVSCGESSSAALTEDGGLYTWGSGLTGQLGHGQHITQYYPKRLVFPSGVRIRQVSCGPYHSGAVCEAGGVYTWGDGYGGKLGHGSNASEFQPRRLESVKHVLGISCGYWHTAIWARYPNNDPTSDVLKMYTWGGHCSWGGDHNKGCLGNGKKTGEWRPHRVEGPLGFKSVKQVACGLNLTLALTQDGEVYQMGTTGAEAAQVPWERALLPVRVEGPLRRLKIEQISCGKSHVIAIGASVQDRKTHLFSWGAGKRGQLGLGSYQDHTTPQLVEDLSSRRILNVCCGGDYTLVVCSHDHKVAAANFSPLIEFLPSPSTPESSSGPSQSVRRRHKTHGPIINANQLRLSSKKTIQGAQRDSLEPISSVSSIRKMKSDLFNGPGGRLDRSRTGSTPLSDAQSSLHDLKGTPRIPSEPPEGRYGLDRARSQTPDDHLKLQETLPTSLSNQYSSTGSSKVLNEFPVKLMDGNESFASDPGDEGSSDDDNDSNANTDGHLTHDAYSEEDEISSQGRRSEKSLSSVDQGLSKSLADSFRTPICPFPPTSIEDRFQTSQNPASSARLRSRQRGLERRLGVMDTWASEQVISKHSSVPVGDLMLDRGSIVRSVQTARIPGVQEEPSSSRRAGSGYEHRRSASAQNLMLSTLNEDSALDPNQQKLTKLLEDIERKLVALAASRKLEMIRSLTQDFSFLSKVLGPENEDSEKKIDSFFELETVQKTQGIISRVFEMLENLPTSNLTALEDESNEGKKLKFRLASCDQAITGIRSLVNELRSLYHADSVHRRDNPHQDLLRNDDSGLIGTFASNEDPEEGNSSQLISTDGQSVHYWRERVDAGVTIVFQSTVNGSTKIKNVRFSKRMFAWEEAQRWWEENQDRLIEQYGLEPGYDPLQETNTTTSEARN